MHDNNNRFQDLLQNLLLRMERVKLRLTILPHAHCILGVIVTLAQHTFKSIPIVSGIII